LDTSGQEKWYSIGHQWVSFEGLDKRVPLSYFAMQSEFMNDLHKALGDISSIRRQMARSTEFRGYGPMTLAVTGATAIAAAGAQAFWLPEPKTSQDIWRSGSQRPCCRLR
jgi:hypothetical protein